MIFLMTKIDSDMIIFQFGFKANFAPQINFDKISQHTSELTPLLHKQNFYHIFETTTNTTHNTQHQTKTPIENLEQIFPF